MHLEAGHLKARVITDFVLESANLQLDLIGTLVYSEDFGKGWQMLLPECSPTLGEASPTSCPGWRQAQRIFQGSLHSERDQDQFHQSCLF